MHRTNTKKKGRIEGFQRNCMFDLQHTLRKVPIVLLGNLRPVRWSLENGRIIVDVLHVNHDGGVVLLQVIRCCETKFVLNACGGVREETERING